MVHIKTHVEKLAKQNIRLFQLKSGEKLPVLYHGWKNKATDNLESLDASFMFNDKDLTHFNLGVRTGATGIKDRYLFVVDVDVSKGKLGFETLMELELEGYSMDETYTVQTPTGGVHYYYFTKTPYGCGTNSIGRGVDHRCEGGYVVGAGSKLVSGEYTVLNTAPIVQMPAWLEELMQRHNLTNKTVLDEEELRASMGEIDYTAKFELAKKFLENAEPAIEGQGGNEKTYKVMARLKDFGLTVSEAVTLAEKYWNDRCEPPWDMAELTTIARNAYKYGSKPAGSAFETLVSFSEIKPKYEDESAEESLLKDFNARFAALKNYRVGTRIGEFSSDGELMHDYSTADFKVVFGNTHIRLVNELGVPKLKPAPEVWLAHPERRTVTTFFELDENKIEFTPESTEYNMFRGFNFEPCSYDEASEVSRSALLTLQEHIFENVCGADQELNNLLWAWMAQTLMRPKVKLQVVPCLVSDARGTGKSIMADIMCNLLDPYAVRINASALVESFNSIIARRKLVCIEEMYRTSSKAFNATLRDLVTSPRMVVKEKYKVEREENNVLNVMVTSNYQDCVDVHMNERRFAIFEVGRNWMGRHDKWDRLKPFADRYVLDNGLLGAELMDDKWLNFNVLDIFKRINNSHNKLMSLDPLTSFIMEAVIDRVIQDQVFESVTREGVRQQVVNTTYLYEVFKKAYPRYAEHTPMSAFNKALALLIAPGSEPTRRYLHGQRINGIVLPQHMWNKDLNDVFRTYFKTHTSIDVPEDDEEYDLDLTDVPAT